MSDATARAMPGSVPRNGMPPSGGYVYRGLGYDQLDARNSLFGLRMAARRQRLAPDRPVDYWPAYYPGPGVPGRCPDCGYMTAAPGHKVSCGGES